MYTEEDSRAFNAIREIYPKFAGRQDWLNAEHHCTVLVEHGATWAQLRAGVERYAAYVTAGGASSPKYVLTPGKFFSGADRPWEQTWAVPEGTGANGVSQRRVTIAEYDELSRKRLAELPGEDPGPL